MQSADITGEAVERGGYAFLGCLNRGYFVIIQSCGQEIPDQAAERAAAALGSSHQAAIKVFVKPNIHPCHHELAFDSVSDKRCTFQQSVHHAIMM